MKKISTLANLLLLIVVAGISACTKGTNTATTIPTLVTVDVVTDNKGTSAYTGGFVTSGVSNYTAYGVCYSTTNQEPTIADTKVTENVVSYIFSNTLTGLTPNTVYYLRAYATNSAGTGYGNTIKFTTGGDVSGIFAQVSTFAGNGAPGFANGTGTAASFNAPTGVATDASGNIYVADASNSSIRKITPGGVVTTLAGNGVLGYQDGPGATAQFYSPSGLAVDAAGNVYVADRGNHLIRKITASGVVSTLAGSGSVNYNDGTGAAASFNTPTAVALDASGANLYVADLGNNLIRKVTTATGAVSTIAGSRTQGFKNGISTEANFNKPSGIALDAAGNIYVAEAGSNVIRKITSDFLVNVYVGGPGATTVVAAPTSLAFDAAGNMYITDRNGRILKINTQKQLTVLAGTSGTNGSTNGSGSTALFNGPSGIAADAQGNVYVADAGNNLIRKVK